MLKCHDPVYQGYHSVLAKCVAGNDSLPYTGMPLLIILLVGLALLGTGLLLHNSSKEGK